jgi:hypothetical protein
VVDATRATVDNEAELVAASARLSCPLAISYLAVSVQDLMAADTRRARRRRRHRDRRLEGCGTGPTLGTSELCRTNPIWC